MERFSQEQIPRQDYLNLTNRSAHKESGLSARTKAKSYKISSLVKSTISSDKNAGNWEEQQLSREEYAKTLVKKFRQVSSKCL